MKKFSILFNYLRPMKWQILVLAFFFLVAGIISLPIPIMQKHIIDNLIPGKKNTELILMIFSIMSLMALNYGSGYLKSKSSIKLRQRILTQIRIDIYEQLQKMDLAFLKKNQSGSLLSRVLNDAGMIQNLAIDQVLSVIVSFIKVIVTAVILFQMNAELSLLSLTVLPGVIAVFLVFKSKIYTKSRKLQESFARVSGKIRENIAAISIIQAENAEEQKGGETLRYCRDLEKASVDKGITGSRGNILISLLSNIPLFGIIWGVGGYMVMNGLFSLGSLIAYYQYIFVIIGPISTFFGFAMNIQSGLAAVDRISEILNTRPGIADKKNARSLLTSISEVRFQNVEFSYPDRNDAGQNISLLKNINLKIKRGEKIGIVGPNGSGKTTITQLLLRQCDFTQGAIYLNGEDIRNYKIKDIRDKIAYVSQEQFFFNDTLRNNLTLGREIPDREIFNALNITGVLEFVNSLENGLDTIMSEQGSTLSGGERQLLSLTRAFLKKPDIYIFDEPFSFIDARNEQSFQQSLERVTAGITTIIISHKPAVLQMVDRVAVLSGGSIIETGTPDALMLRRSHLFDLFCHQTANETGK